MHPYGSHAEPAFEKCREHVTGCPTGAPWKVAKAFMGGGEIGALDAFAHGLRDSPEFVFCHVGTPLGFAIGGATQVPSTGLRDKARRTLGLPIVRLRDARFPEASEAPPALPRTETPRRAKVLPRTKPPAGVKPVRVKFAYHWDELCKRHREFGPIQCCPFPDCPNGLSASETWIAVDSHVGEDRFYQRTSWDLGEGRATWSWEEPRLRFLSIPKVYWNEGHRRDLLPPIETTRSAFHYTSLQGFLGLLGSHELWLSDYGFLNDASEVAHGLQRAADAFARIAAQRPTSRAMLSAQTRLDLSRHRICIASFSTQGDSLSQWRAYGPIAVGFDLSPLSFGYANSVRMAHVVYSADQQDELLEIYASLLASAWEGETVSARRKHRDLYCNTPGRLLDIIAFFKNAGFADERELRMIHSEDTELLARFPIDPAPDRVRASGGLLVPYATTRDIHRDHPERLPIREVIVGPGPQSELLRQGVERALRANGYDAPVVVSGVTYRP